MVDAAIRIADARGVDAVSMRSLAAELGVEAMSLYCHVPGKKDLLGMMADRLLNSVPIPPRTLPPQRRLRQLAVNLRALARAHPNVFPLVVLTPLQMSASARPTEIALQALRDAGVSDPCAIRKQRVFLSFVRGYLLWEIGGFMAGRWNASDATLHPAAVAELESLDPGLFPECRRLARTFSRISPNQAFEEGLSSLLAVLLPDRAKKDRSS